MAMIFFSRKRNLFREAEEKVIELSYDVINDVMMMQYIYQWIKYFISAED